MTPLKLSTKFILKLILASFLSSLFAASFASADEFSIIQDSSVIGRNYGYPLGTGQDDITPKSFEIVTEAVAFTKNIEIASMSDEGIEGETYMQTMMPLRLRYKASPVLTFEAGAVLGHKFGDENDVDIAEPLLRLVAEPKENLFFIAGTIFPTHWIHDAIFDDVQKFGTNNTEVLPTDPSYMEFDTNVEQGFQLRTDFKNFKEDLWINWKVREEADTREEFEAASSSSFRLFSDSLHLDLHLRSVHIGGQNNNLDKGVDSNFTYLGGISYGFKSPFGNKSMKDLRFGASYLGSSDDTLQAHTSTETGSGYEITASMEIETAAKTIIRIHASHYTGEDFYSRRGDQLYQLDNYTQVGATALFKPDGDLRIETGAVVQQTEDVTNFTFMVNFFWGHNFILSKNN